MLRLFRSLARAQPSSPQPTPRKSLSSTFFKYLMLGVIGSSIFITYNYNYLGKTEFILAETELNRRLLEGKSKLFKQDFKATPYLPTLYLQYFYKKYLQRRIFIREQTVQAEHYTLHLVDKHHEIVELEKMGKLSLVPITLVVTGTEGFDELAKSIAVFLSANKFEVIGLSLNDLNSKDKLVEAINQIKHSNKDRSVYAVGVEYGANLLTIAAAENQRLVDSLVSVGNPLDLEAAQRKVENSIMADLTFLPDLKKKKSAQKPELSSMPLYEIDQHLYNIGSEAEVKQFKSSHSSINYLNRLNIPALFVNSKQDPLSINIMQRQELGQNKNTIFMVTNQGGHNEWYYGLEVYMWVPRLVSSYFLELKNIALNHGELLVRQ